MESIIATIENNKITEVFDCDGKVFKYTVGCAALVGCGLAVAATAIAGKNSRLIRQTDAHNASDFKEVRGMLSDLGTEVAYGAVGVPVIVNRGEIAPVDMSAIKHNYNYALSQLMAPQQAPQYQPMIMQPPQPVQQPVQQMPAPQYAPAPVKQDPQEAATAAIMGNPALMQQIIAGVVNAMTPPASDSAEPVNNVPASTTKKK